MRKIYGEYIHYVRGYNSATTSPRLTELMKRYILGAYMLGRCDGQEGKPLKTESEFQEGQ